MATLNALKKARILNEMGDAIVNGYAIVSSDPAVLGVSNQHPDYVWHATGITAGTATINATRLLDNATASLDVTVVAATPFAISLGAEVPA